MDGVSPCGAVVGDAGGIGFHIEGERNFQFIGGFYDKDGANGGRIVVDVDGIFPGEPKEKISASTSTSTSTPVFPLSRYVHAT